MTEIDVPDWVVDESLAARLPDGSSVRSQIKTPWEMTTMRAALTAALGAWVVPVMWKHERCGWTPINEALIATRGQINYAYTLRQEKPE